MWRMGILGCSIQSPHQESVLSGIMWRIGFWVTLIKPPPHPDWLLSGIMWRIGILGTLFNPLTGRGCSVALFGELAFWVTLFNPFSMIEYSVALCGELAYG